MTYFHPRDFDKDQPMINDLSVVRKFKSYYGLNGSIKKFNELLRRFDFMDIRAADSLIDWEKSPEVILQ
jgi:hypothetical protein